MDVTPQQAREWVRLFPRHPALWLLVAAALVALLARRAQPPDQLPRPDLTSLSATDADSADRDTRYGWLSRKERARYQPLADRLPPPAGFMRVAVAAGSFGDWLRHLPCAPPDTPVRDGHGKPLRPADDTALAAVIELRPGGPRLLGACNMLIRLRGEYLWSAGRLDGLVLHFTSGAEYPWKRFAAGERPGVRGREVTWKLNEDPAATRAVFTAYLEMLFAYSSSISLEHDTLPAGDAPILPGDLFVISGRPGHAVQVLDVAEGPAGAADAPRATAILIGEGHTPPQSFHVLKGSDGSAWFIVQPPRPDRPGAPIALPTWPLVEWRSRRTWAEPAAPAVTSQPTPPSR